MAGFDERLQQVRGRIEAACGRAGRDPAAVRLLPISKTFGPERIAEAVSCGMQAMGESRVQEAREKIPRCSGGLEWHMVGHLQRNKAREAVSLFSMIHSVDSGRLAETLERVCEEDGSEVRICLQVNVSGEGSKTGADPAAAPALVSACGSLRRVSLVGLMAIPPFGPDAELARAHFRALRELRDRCQDETGVVLPELSMGMSHDFEVAVEEGATWIRLGSALFGERRSGSWRPGAEEETYA
jgi:pyridoxal phosphate enzyme (YggS family)